MNYLITPFLAWLVAGGLKFLINSIQAKKLASHLIGYGGMPSNHSAIVSSTTILIAQDVGIHHPAFGVALTTAFIVLIDANSLRRQIGKQATVINQLSMTHKLPVLRERIGHTRWEILAGVAVGAVVATCVNQLSQ